jgi:cell wall-associated NlpC family hydrolase
MATREELIAAARTWLRTPHVHQGRLKGVACDCVGVPIGAARETGLVAPDFDVTGYARNPDPALMRAKLDEFMDRIPKAEMKGGDLLFLIPGRRIPQHVALLTFDRTMIHAIDEVRGVSEHILDDRWRRAIVDVYRFRGLED